MPLDKQEELKDVEREEQSEPQKKTWLETLPTFWKFIGAVFIVLVIMSMMKSENKNLYLMILGIVLIVLYTMGKSQPEQETFLTPLEAELRVELEMQRKVAWRQFPPMTKFSLNPINNLFMRDADGKYYTIGITVKVPWQHVPEYYQAKVYGTGKLKGIVSLIRTKTELHGREKPPQKTILPPLLKAARKDDLIKGFVEKMGRL